MLSWRYLKKNIPQKAVRVIIMIYKDTKDIVPSSDTDIDFICVWILQVYSLAPFLFIISQDYIYEPHKIR